MKIDLDRLQNTLEQTQEENLLLKQKFNQIKEKENQF